MNRLLCSKRSASTVAATVQLGAASSTIPMRTFSVKSKLSQVLVGYLLTDWCCIRLLLFCLSICTQHISRWSLPLLALQGSRDLYLNFALVSTRVTVFGTGRMAVCMASLQYTEPRRCGATSLCSAGAATRSSKLAQKPHSCC